MNCLLTVLALLSVHGIFTDCALPVRLRDGDGPHEGRVEVFYRNAWGTICDDGWTLNDAKVICRSLGYSGNDVQYFRGSTFRPGSGNIWLDDVSCTGQEAAIEACRHKPFGESNCLHNEDAGVSCQSMASPIRLVGGNTTSSGRVEVYLNRSAVWGTVCDDSWDRKDAGVVCSQLGFLRSPAIPVPLGYFGEGTGPVAYDNTECVGTESSLNRCHSLRLHSDCGHREDAGVICFKENDTLSIEDVRLDGGSSEYEGRLQVKVANNWGTVCNRRFTTSAAQVACKMMGWSGGQLLHENMGTTNGPIWLSEVRCMGSEKSLMDCGHTDLGILTCSHSQDVLISCTPVTPQDLPIRLVGGSTPYEGRVEVSYKGTWGTVCDDSWDVRDAAVVCRMLNYSSDGAVAVSKHGFGMGQAPILLDDVECEGSESSLSLCNIAGGWNQSNCDHTEDAGVICHPAGTVMTNVTVRLAGGPDAHSGRLEVFHNNQWGTVCDDGFGLSAAKVVCRMLGYLTFNMTVFRGAHFGAGHGPILLDDVVCRGSESNIALCGSRGWGRSNCGHAEDVSMSCAGGSDGANVSVRLAGGQSSHEGRVEVRRGDSGQWGTVCDTHWDANAAIVVCRMLGLPSDGAQPRRGSFFGPGSGQVLLGDVRCTGQESSLEVCEHSPWGTSRCGHSHDAGVICGGVPRVPIRLVGAGDTSRGRVEIYLNHTWGTVCDDAFGQAEATVICRMLGYSTPGAKALRASTFGGSSGPIHLDDLSCLGSEVNILQCAAKGVGKSDCDHREDAGVICNQERVHWRLANGNSSSGRLEVLVTDQWGTVCDDSFDSRSAVVACRTLGLPSLNAHVVRTSQFGPGTGNIVLDDVRCTGNERNLLDCRHRGLLSSNCHHSEDVGIVCGTELQENSTTVRLVHGMTAMDGRVEVLYNGQWGTVCDDGFTVQAAQVVCKWLGAQFAKAVVQPSRTYVQGSGTIVLDDLNCVGNESSLFDCRHRAVGTNDCSHTEDVGIKCLTAAQLQSKIRLVNGSSSHSGRVEVYHEGSWGTICDDSWGVHEAAVACRQLGFQHTTGIPVPEGYFGEGSGSVLLDEMECAGTESQISYCGHDPWGRHDCDHSEDAGVICLTGVPDPTVRARLVGGLAVNQGRVEVKYSGFWGTICDDDFDNQDASVICRMIGYPRGGRVLTQSEVGSGTGPVWLDELSCSGTEDSLANCTSRGWGENDCDHTEDAGVFCYPDMNLNFTVRLVNGPTPTEGRVELFHGNAWHSVCDDGWSAADAAVVCRMLNLGSDGAVAVGSAAYGQGTGSILLDDVTCLGTEYNLAQCQSAELGVNNCDHSEDAGVKCTAAGQVVSGVKVRLMNGPNPRSGRVEVFYNNVWGTICDDHWDNNDAAVVCRMLQFPAEGALARGNAFFGRGTGRIQLDDMACLGTETSLQLCRHRPWGVSNCQHHEDAGVVCQGGDLHPTSVRLVGGLRPNEGRVEVLYNGTWGTVCDDMFGIEEAKVVCRSLSYPVEGAQYFRQAHYGPGSGTIVYDNLRCRGTETILDLCSHNQPGVNDCSHSEDVGVLCPAAALSRTPIRLVHGPTPSQGRVEIQINGTWGTVCDDLFSSKAAAVVCSMLGFQRAGAAVKTRAFFGRGSGPIYLDDVVCNGNEASILECRAKPIGQENCNHGEDVGVICVTDTVNLRLVGGSSRYEGRLEISINGTWGTVCDDSFGTSDAMVACRMMGMPTAGARVSSVRRTGTGRIWLDDLGCTGRETTLLQCRHRSPLGSSNCGHTEDVSIICPGTLSLSTSAPTLAPTPPLATHDPSGVFVRLSGGATAYDGRVEVYHANSYGPVCSHHWTVNNSQVICGMLGYSRAGAVTKTRGVYNSPTPSRAWLDYVNCRGSEANIAQCPSTSWGASHCDFSLDVGVVCSSDVRPDRFLLLTESNGIYRMDTRTYSYVPLPQVHHEGGAINPIAIDYDPVESQIYWTDVSKKQIWTSNLDGSRPRMLVQRNSMAVLDGLAIDPTSRVLYFTDKGNQAITVMSLDGFAERTIIDSNIQNPRAIALHPVQALMFWTDWGDTAKIERSQMDGTDRRTIVTTGIKWPNGLAIDYRGSRLYWCDGGTMKVESTDFHGQGRRTILQDQHSQPFGITVAGSYLYFSDWQARSVMKVQISGGTKVAVGPPTFNRLNGLVFYRKGAGITGTSGCSKSRGGCSHLCIPGPRGTKKCVCPDNLTLQPDGLTCGTDVPCPPLDPPVMGEYTPDNCTSENSTSGTVCQVTCRAGFSLAGSSQVTCLGSGQWSHFGSAVVCTDTQPPVLKCPADISAAADKGSTSATVKWTVPTVTENGDGTVQITQSMHSPTSLTEGRYTVFVTATDGRGLSSSCTFRIIVTVKRCPPLTLPDSASLATPFCPVYYGSTCPVQCRPGYKPTNKKLQQVVCDQSEGGVMGWTTSQISCSPVICPALKASQNAAVTGCGSLLMAGTVCGQQCNHGYRQTGGTASRMCSMDGSWTGSPIVCTMAPSCPSLTSPANGLVVCQAPYTVGTLCTQRCNSGFSVARGTLLRQCQGDGTWSGAPLRCAQVSSVQCSDLKPPANGQISGCEAPFSPGALCQQSCNDGFVKSGGTTNRQCQTGGWSGSPLVCVKALTCQQLPAPANGNVVGCPVTSKVGGLCAQSCNHGYKMSGGSPLRQCQKDGSWSGEMITCTWHNTTNPAGRTQRQTGSRRTPRRGGGTGPAIIVLGVFVGFLILAAVIVGLIVARKKGALNSDVPTRRRRKTYELKPTETYDDRSVFDQGPGLVNPMYGDGDGEGEGAGL